MSRSEATAGRRGLRDWLTDTPDAANAPAVQTAAHPTPGPAATTDSGRPRKAERQAARRREFFAARRNRATTPLARLEVAVDLLRAVGTERDLADATTALEQIAGRRL